MQTSTRALLWVLLALAGCACCRAASTQPAETAPDANALADESVNASLQLKADFGYVEVRPGAHMFWCGVS